MNERRINLLRSINYNLNDYYKVNIKDYEELGTKSYLITDEDDHKYFLKETNYNVLEKYQFLANQGINNILYPTLNKEKKYITRSNNDAYYLNEYVESLTIIDDIKVKNMYDELNLLHEGTSFKRQLSPRKSRAKFDEISNQLDAKFRVLEAYIRSVETRTLNPDLMPILANYQYILDAKKELIRLQKRIISSVKAKESVNYSFLHNNPQLDHLLLNKGSRYLTSIDKGKIGISSLDMAKLYLENERRDIDFNSLLKDFHEKYRNPFYYDYFRYLILVINIKQLNLTNEDYLNGVIFNQTSMKLKKYFENFKDYPIEEENTL